jgi:putative ABC transport system permease protein
MYCYSIDSDFLPVYGIELVSGRNFDPTIDIEPSKAFLISESGVQHMKWSYSEDALGQEIVTGNGGRSGKIVGVFKDFNFASLHYSIEPLFMEYYPDDFGYFTLNVQSKNLPHLMAQIQDVWGETFPNIPFNYFFADTAFNDQYKNEMKAISLMSYFSFLAIFIACSGLIGISLFIFQLRTKEIGIRKVLGASVPALIKLLNRNFIFWVALANLLAWPIAYFMINKWLQNFSYRSTINLFIFFCVGCITIILSMIVLSFQTFRTAHTNPAIVIKYE